MIDHEHFIQRIQSEDDPCTAIGIYADWLEEQGDPRAKLLRLIVKARSSGPPECDPLPDEIHKSIRDLFWDDGPTWKPKCDVTWFFACRGPGIFFHKATQWEEPGPYFFQCWQQRLNISRRAWS